jgi:pimeloyl-ACP methyl ester carboxylesterase
VGEGANLPRYSAEAMRDSIIGALSFSGPLLPVLEILKLLAVVLAGVAVTACAFQERLIFFRQPPAPAPQLQPPAVLEDVALRAADGTRLQGWLARRPAGRAPLLIYFGGNAEETSWLVGQSHRFGGWSVLGVNYRGYGRSEGDPGETALLSDALAVYDYALARKDVDPARVAVMGRSLGSGVAVYLASRRPVLGVVLVTPFDSLVEVAAMHYPYLPVRWMLRHRFDSIALAPGIRSPALVLAAAQDNVVPPRHARRLYEAWGGPHNWVEFPAVGHNDIDADPAYWSSIRGFLETLLQEGGRRP